MGEPVYDYDPAESLETPEAITVFVSEALETGERSFISYALGVAARAKGMSQLARDTGLSRSALYETFSEDEDPTLETTLTLLKHLGVDLSDKPNVEPGTAKT